GAEGDPPDGLCLEGARREARTLTWRSGDGSAEARVSTGPSAPGWTLTLTEGRFDLPRTGRHPRCRREPTGRESECGKRVEGNGHTGPRDDTKPTISRSRDQHEPRKSQFVFVRRVTQLG